MLFYSKTSVEYIKRQTISRPELWPHLLKSTNNTQKSEVKIHNKCDHKTSLIMIDSLSKRLSSSKKLKSCVIKLPKEFFCPSIQLITPYGMSYRSDQDSLNKTIYNNDTSYQNSLRTIQDLKEPYLYQKVISHQPQLPRNSVSSLNLSNDTLNCEPITTCNMIKINPIGIKNEKNKASYLRSNWKMIAECNDCSTSKSDNINMSTQNNTNIFVQTNNINYGYYDNSNEKT